MNDDENIKLLARNMLATEFDGRAWHLPSKDRIPLALVTYAEEENPETGHRGWCWWADGKLGEAATYEDAKRAAEYRVKLRIVLKAFREYHGEGK